MKSKIKTVFIFWFLFLFVARLLAQDRYLRGTVINSNNITISDASVIIKETLSGTSTNANGGFTLKIGNEKNRH
ncbi:MAG: hypothetical protein ABI472_24435 [Ginsengibacter sp.]